MNDRSDNAVVPHAKRIDGGFFVSFEGPEAAGKSTQAQQMADELHDRGYPVTVTREPGGTYLGEALRDLVKRADSEEAITNEAELLLFGASRAQLMYHVIEPRLAKGEIVICDRFADSTTVYQGMVRGLPLAFIQSMHHVTTKGRMPDLTILLDVDIETSLQRQHGRANGSVDEHDRFEAESRAFHKRIREEFLTIAEQYPDRFRVVNADAPEQQVKKKIEDIIDNALECLQ